MDKRDLKSIIIYIISAVASLLFIAYIVYHLINSFTGIVETTPAQVVTVSDSYSVDGYIFKDESLLGTTDNGTVTYLYEDGTMIRRGNIIANVYSTNNSQEVETQLNSIEKKLNILKKSAVSSDMTVSDSSAVDSEIDSLYYSIHSRKSSGDLSYAFRRKDDFLSLLNKRQMILKSSDIFALSTAELESQISSITSSLGGVTQTVVADRSGYLFYEVDGYEGSFTGDVAKTMTVEGFQALIQQSPITAQGKSIGKIATDFTWYLACEIPAVQQQYYIEGNKYTVKFPYSGDQEISMTLSRIVTSQEQDKIVVVFSTGVMPDGFNFLRKQAVEIIQESYTGYRIPVSCVRMIDDKKGVFVKDGNLCVFKEIDPIAEINGYLVVAEQDKANDPDYASKLGNYDLVITKGKDLYENKIIE